MFGFRRDLLWVDSHANAHAFDVGEYGGVFEALLRGS
ncbi:MAG: hypothetical protein ACJAU9_000806 [Lentimonas sp.]|jgi:hypothetical protein